MGSFAGAHLRVCRDPELARSLLLRVEDKRPSDDRLGEPSAAIREWVEAASCATIASVTAHQ